MRKNDDFLRQLEKHNGFIETKLRRFIFINELKPGYDEKNDRGYFEVKAISSDEKPQIVTVFKSKKHIYYYSTYILRFYVSDNFDDPENGDFSDACNWNEPDEIIKIGSVSLNDIKADKRKVIEY